MARRIGNRNNFFPLNFSNLIYVCLDKRLPKKSLIETDKRDGQVSHVLVVQHSWKGGFGRSRAVSPAAVTHRQQLISDNLRCWETKARGYFNFSPYKTPSVSQIGFFLAFSTSCKCPHKCKILELINCLVLILPSSRKNIGLTGYSIGI